MTHAPTNGFVRPRYEGVITLGNIISIITVIIAVTAGYTQMRTELTHERENRLKLERQIAETRRDILDTQRSQLQELRQAVRELEARVGLLSERLAAQSRSSGVGGPR
ncbi:hypothetical protein [Elioraea sp.]|uniref:hypothetical protein n=1 Tax=Elioraea sp. TaxID=2185103 RepID=UPI003F722F80